MLKYLCESIILHYCICTYYQAVSARYTGNYVKQLCTVFEFQRFVFHEYGSLSNIVTSNNSWAGDPLRCECGNCCLSKSAFISYVCFAKGVCGRFFSNSCLVKSCCFNGRRFFCFRLGHVFCYRRTTEAFFFSQWATWEYKHTGPTSNHLIHHRITLRVSS